MMQQQYLCIDKNMVNCQAVPIQKDSFLKMCFLLDSSMNKRGGKGSWFMKSGRPQR